VIKSVIIVGLLSLAVGVAASRASAQDGRGGGQGGGQSYRAADQNRYPEPPYIGPGSGTGTGQYVGPGSGSGMGQYHGPGSGTGMGRCQPVQVEVCRRGAGDGRGPRCWIENRVRC